MEDVLLYCIVASRVFAGGGCLDQGLVSYATFDGVPPSWACACIGRPSLLSSCGRVPASWKKLLIPVALLGVISAGWWIRDTAPPPALPRASVPRPTAPSLPVASDTGLGRLALTGATPARGLIAFGARRWQSCEDPSVSRPVAEMLRGGQTLALLADVGGLRDGGWGLYVEGLTTTDPQTGHLQLLDAQRVVRVDLPQCPDATPAVEALVTVTPTDSLLLRGPELRWVTGRAVRTWTTLENAPRLGDTLRLVATDSAGDLTITLWRTACVRTPRREVVALRATVRRPTGPALLGCGLLGPLGLDGDRLGLERPSGTRLQRF